jgi:hypothetical protein
MPAGMRDLTIQAKQTSEIKADILADNPASSSRSEKYSPQSMTGVGGDVAANDVI